MEPKKLIVVMIALLAGAGAFYLTMTGTEQPDPVPVPAIQATKEKTVGVLVASLPIQRGDRLSGDNFEWREWPERVVSQSGDFILSNVPEVLEDLEGAVAKVSLVEGEPIMESKVVRAGSSGLMAAIMTPGMRAVALRVTAETAAGGFILPGDRVDVIFSKKASREEKGVTKTLFQNVRVLAVNEIFSENPETPVIEGVNVTLELDPYSAERFIAARSDGELSLSLRAISDTVAAQDKPEQKRSGETKRVKVIRVGRS